MHVPKYRLNALFMCGIVPEYGGIALKRCACTMWRPKLGVKGIYLSGSQIHQK